MAATPIDMVRNRLRRELEPEELRLAAELLDHAESVLRSRIPDAPDRLATDAQFRALFTATAATAVQRVLVNPDGYRQESVGPYSWSYDTRAAAGFLTILDEEWTALGVGGDAVSVVPFGVAPPWARGPAEGVPRIPFNPLTSPGYWGNLS